MAEEWYYLRGGAKAGPVSAPELKQLASHGQLTTTDMVWKQGMPSWVPAEKVKGLFGALPSNFASSPPSSATPPRFSQASALDGPDAQAESPGALSLPPARLGQDLGPGIEHGLAASILGTVVLLGFFAPVLLATLLGWRTGAILMIVCFLALSVIGVVMAILGLMRFIRRGASGGALSFAGLCISGLAFLTTVMALIVMARDNPLGGEDKKGTPRAPSFSGDDKWRTATPEPDLVLPTPTGKPFVKP